jgi:hypothetical protein
MLYDTKKTANYKDSVYKSNKYLTLQVLIERVSIGRDMTFESFLAQEDALPK